MDASDRDVGPSEARILAAARELFSTHAFEAVTMRDIAKAADVTHGLVHHYFGSKEQLVSVIFAEEVAAAEARAKATFDPGEPLESLRRSLRYYLTEGGTTVMLLARIASSGIEPGSVMGTAAFLPLGRLAQFMASSASGDPTAERPDPRLVAAYIGAALFALVPMHPWLFNAVGLPAEDYERRVDELVDISLTLVMAAVRGVSR